MFPEPLLNPTVVAEGAPVSRRPGLPSDLGEPAAGFHAARPRQADWRQALPREQAIANAYPARGVRGGIAWEELQEPQAGVGWKQPPFERILPEPGLYLLPRLARESLPSLPSGRERSGSWRTRRCAPSRNSFLPEAKNARDRPRGFPDQDIRRCPQTRGKTDLQSLAKTFRHPDGVRAPCQNSDRVRQAP